MFRELLYYGRLPFSGLLHHTHLTPRQLKHSLAVLIQQHLVLWYTFDDNTTVYEAELNASYALVRSGKYIKNVEDRFGQFSGDVLSNFLLLGHARVGDLAQAINVSHPRNAKTVIEIPHGISNGTADSAPASKQVDGDAVSYEPILESLHRALSELLQAGLLTIVHESHFRSETDNRSEAERETPQPEKYTGRLKKEQLLEWEQKIQKKLQEWRHGNIRNKTGIEALSRVRKRPREESESESKLDWKRLRLDLPLNKEVISNTGYDSNLRLLDSSFLDENLVLRVNYDKLDVLARNQRLVELAQTCIGTTTSKVYAALLRAVEPGILRCKPLSSFDEGEDEEVEVTNLPQAATQKLAALLEDSMDFTSAIGHADPSKIALSVVDHPKKRRRKPWVEGDLANGASVDGNASSDEDEDDDSNSNLSDIESGTESLPSSISHTPPSKLDPTAPHPKNSNAFSSIRQHLLLLCEHPYRFLHRVRRTSGRPESWAVDYRTLDRTLLHTTLSQTITARHGPLATRITNILRDKGKLDEKALSTFSLTNLKPLRPLLTAMHQSGLLQLQEIPRDASRQPSRTLFLWDWNPVRAAAKVLEESYGAMERLVQRLREEKGKVRALLEKAERSDVVGREAEFLSQDERSALRTWKQLEERIWVQVARLDEVIAVVKDV